MPSLDHSLTQARLVYVLMRDFENKFTFSSELSLDIIPKGATPDICVYPKMERVIGQQADTIKMKEAPITTIEILSPSQALDDVIDKIRSQYFPNGVQSAWVVIPSMRAIALAVPGQKAYTFFTKGKLTDPATGISVDVDEVFKV